MYMLTPESNTFSSEPLFLKSENSIPIENQANYKGNYSELVFSRLNNPVIRSQLLDLIEENERWIQAHPPTKEVLKKDQHGEILTDDIGIPIFERVPDVYIPKSKKEIEASIREALEREQHFTQVDFQAEPDESVGTAIDQSADITNPNNRTVRIGVKRNSSVPLSENEIRNMSIIESHEKGHVFRVLRGSGFLEEKFSRAFDVSKISPNNYLPDRPAESTDQQVIDSAREYLFNFKSPHELIERMSQLKSYFGMKGDEKFTPQHLEYARKHYLEDGMMDNNMKTFFEAITPETEFTFLKLINSIGV
jgi:hypothetical protein